MKRLLLLLPLILFATILGMEMPGGQMPVELSIKTLNYVLNRTITKEELAKTGIPEDVLKDLPEEVDLLPEEALEEVKKYAAIDPKVETSEQITDFLIHTFANKWFEGNLIKAALMLNTSGTQKWLDSDEAKKWVSENAALSARFLAQAGLKEEGLIYHPNELETFLRLGASPNIVQEGYHTPLIYNILDENIENIRLLLSYKANPNLGSPLYYVVNPDMGISKQNQLKIIQLLLAAGANPNLPIEATDGKTALQIAQEEAQKNPSYNEIVKLLKERNQ